MKYVYGTGNPAEGTACVMSAEVARLRLERGEPIGDATDELDCACPVLRKLLIWRNDATPVGADLDTWAASWIGRIAGTRRDHATTVRRAEACARYAVTVIAADAMESAGLRKQSERLRGMSATSSMNELRSAAADAAAYAAANAANAAYAAYAAYAAAYADAAAAYAANTANADAAAYAAYAAANAAANAAYAANAAAKRLTYIDAMIALVMEIQ